jgi:hypothetical protein
MSFINFTNAVATLKDGAVIDEAKLRDNKVYAKLMMKAGSKFGEPKSAKDFLLSEKGTHIRAELFIITKSGNMVIDNRLWVNVNIDAYILRDDATRMYFVELIHPTVDLSSAVEAFPATPTKRGASK